MKILTPFLVILALASGVVAAPIGGSDIVASTSLEHVSPWSIDQISDGVAVNGDNSPLNGFVSPASSGTITLDLIGNFDVNGFVLSNDVNVLQEGIKDFRLNFYDSANVLLASSDVLTAPLGQAAPQTYNFSTVQNVSRVDLVILNCHPDTLNRIEIREVSFLGTRLGTDSGTIQAAAYPAVEIAFPTVNGEVYQVQVASSLAPATWTSFGAPIAGDGTEHSVFDKTRDREKRFYRIVKLQ